MFQNTPVIAEFLWRLKSHRSAPERPIPVPPPVKLPRFHLTQFIDVPPKPCNILHSWIIKQNPSEALDVQSTFAGGVKCAGSLQASRVPGEEEEEGDGI